MVFVVVWMSVRHRSWNPHGRSAVRHDSVSTDRRTDCSRAIRVLCMCMGLGDTGSQREIQVDMNKGEHEQRGKQRCMNRKSCQGRREYVHSRNSRGIKIHSGKMQKP